MAQKYCFNAIDNCSNPYCKPHYWLRIILIVSLTVIYMSTVFPTDAFAETIRIPLTEVNAYRGTEKVDIEGWGYIVAGHPLLNVTVNVDEDGNMIKQSSERGGIVVIMKFKLEEIPTSSLMETITINSATLNFGLMNMDLITYEPAYSTELFIVILHSLSSDCIMEKEGSCDYSEQDFELVNLGIPAEIYSFDVTDSVSEQIAKSNTSIVFAVGSEPIYERFEEKNMINVNDKELLDLLSWFHRGVLSINTPTSDVTEPLPSDLRVKLEHDIGPFQGLTLERDTFTGESKFIYTFYDSSTSFQILNPASKNVYTPKLIIDYTTSPSNFYNYLTLLLSTILPAVATILGGIYWMARKIKS